MIRTEDFCEVVGCALNIPAEFVLEALGSLANLYLEKAIQTDGVLETEVRLAFASAQVLLATIIRELQNSTGFDFCRAQTLLSTMQAVLKKKCEELAVTKPGDAIDTEFLGRFTVIDLPSSCYMLAFTDPAKPHYSSFLLNTRD